MPSAKFTESEVLEPSESFCEREKISEVEADLRAYFAWEKSKPLPGWIYDKLKKYPLLTEHTIKFLHWLSSQPATNKCKAKTCSLYDIMVDCMITDIIMSVLSEYEKQYRIKECRHLPHPASGASAPSIPDASYLSLLFPELPRHSIKMSNLRREPLHIYYKDAKDGSLLPRTLDTEFMQAITVLYHRYVRTPDMRYLLRPAAFLPLMDGHPYFMYSVEKYWGYYQTCCKRTADTVSTFERLREALLDSYECFPAAAPEEIPDTLTDADTSYFVHLIKIIRLLKEWIDFFEDRYYSFSLTGSNFDNPLLSYFNYWPEDLPLDVDTLIYSCFAEPEFARNPNLLALQRLRELINAPDAEQNLSYTLNECKSHLSNHLKELQEALTQAKESGCYAPIYQNLSGLFSPSKSLKAPTSLLVSLGQKKIREFGIFHIKKPFDFPVMNDYFLAVSDFAEQVLKYWSTQPGTSAFWFEREAQAEDHIQELADMHETADTYDRENPFDGWYDQPVTPQPLLFEPNDFVSGPCTRMFFTLLHRQIFPFCLIRKYGEDPDDPADKDRCITDYYLGSCAAARILEQLQKDLVSVNPDDIYCRTTYEIAEEENQQAEQLWLWAQHFLRTNQIDINRLEPSEIQVQTLFLDVTGSNFPLLYQTMEWLYPRSELDALLSEEIEKCGQDFLDPFLSLQISKYNQSHNPDPLLEYAQILNQAGSQYWEFIVKNQSSFVPENASKFFDKYLKFLRSRGIVSSSILALHDEK